MDFEYHLALNEIATGKTSHCHIWILKQESADQCLRRDDAGTSQQANIKLQEGSRVNSGGSTLWQGVRELAHLQKFSFSLRHQPEPVWS